MSLRVRFQYTQGASLGYSIERLADGMNYDFADSTFKATPTTPVAALVPGAGSRAGVYSATISSTPQAQFTNGDYAVYINNTVASNAVIGVIEAVMYNGDDATYFAAGGGGGNGNDPWATILPGAYPDGSAGAILGANLDAKVSSRSTYAGGVVAGVTAPVTVGANQDKSGYVLAPSGLDAVMIEPSVNARQALVPILASAAGAISGAGTGTVVIKGGNSATSRIMATTDNAGNRSSVILTLPT